MQRLLLFSLTGSLDAPDYPRAFLSGFSGTIVTDEYQVYHKIVDEYAEILKSLGDKASKGSIAKQAYDMITKIMHEDNKYDNLTKKDRKKKSGNSHTSFSCCNSCFQILKSCTT